MFNIRLFRYNKKSNSTARPTLSSGSIYQCSMKTSSSIVNPVIDIKVGSNEIPEYNYAYIDRFKRYYYITDTVYSIGVWTLTLVTDVLASYREDILNSKQYVARSYSDYDPDITDAMYLTTLPSYYGKCAYNYYQGAYVGGVLKSNAVAYRFINTGSSGVTSDYFDVGLSGGDFLVGIVGNNATGVNYYVMTYTVFKQFIQKVCSLQPSNMTDVSTGVANAIYNPIQYITTVRWYPQIASYDIDSATSTLNIGGEPVTVSGSIFSLDLEKTVEYWMEIDIPRHPNEEDYPYLNNSPFSEYNLFFQPFGNIPIDATKITGEESLYITWSVDYATGMSHLKVHPYSHLEANPSIIVDTISEYGVTIPISTLVMDVKTGLIVSGMSWLTNAIFPSGAGITGVTDGKSAGSEALSMPSRRNIDYSLYSNTSNLNAGDLIRKGIDALAGAMGQVKSVGASGSFLAYNSGRPYVYAFFYDQAETYPELFGRPCNRQKVLSTLSGFCICENAVVNYSSFFPTESEKNAVLMYLNTGIFIET